MINRLKKLGLYLLAPVALFLVAGTVLQFGNAMAATPNFNLRFGDSNGSKITGSYGGKAFEFAHNTLSGSNLNWIYSLSLSKTGLICSGSTLVVSDTFASKGNAATARAINFKYKTSASANCTSYDNDTIPVAASSGGPAPAAKINWSGTKGVLNSDGSLLEVTFKNGSKAEFRDRNPGDTTINFKPQPSAIGSIGGASVASWCTNTVYSPGGGDVGKGITLASYTATTGAVDVCYNNGGGNVNQTATLATVSTAAYTPPGEDSGDVVAPTDDPEATCQTKFLGASGHQISWLLCPMMAAAQSATEALTNLIENLLSFSVRDSLNGSGAEKAWANVRNISSILLVVIMLIMVLSQAVSWGPFDAYTVRKVLPKLVVAVIAMQLSWSLLTYVFDLFNHIGRGVADLLYQPFGGPEGVTLGKALANSGIDTATASTINWVALGGVAALAVLSLPTLVIAVWAVVVALLTGFIVLVFRQILLIACLIFAPLAILAWILPNTNRYWKLWYDNFTKLLLMFPMIMGILAAGKIFAIITGDSSSAGSAGTLLRFIFVVVGFYGPYFLLPKTYKWGGAAMAAASGAIGTAVTKGGGPISNYLEGKRERSRWNQARTQRKAELTRRAQIGFAEGLTTGSRFRRGLNQTRTLSLGRRKAEKEIRDRIVKTAQATRDKQLTERAQEAVLPLAQAENWSALANMAVNGETPQEQDAAIAELVKNRRFGDLTNAGIHNTPQWTRAFNTNKDVNDTVKSERADLAPKYISPPAGVAPIGVGQLASGTAPGVSVEQLGTQNADFFKGADAAIPAGPELDKYVDRLHEVARSPNAIKILGTDKETEINVSLAKHHAAHGGGGVAPRFSDIVQKVRAPGATSPPTEGIVRGAPAAITTTQLAIFQENELQVGQRVQAAGGWDNFVATNPDDAMFIYQHKTDDVKEQAGAALRRGGHIA